MQKFAAEEGQKLKEVVQLHQEDIRRIEQLNESLRLMTMEYNKSETKREEYKKMWEEGLKNLKTQENADL